MYYKTSIPFRSIVATEFSSKSIKCDRHYSIRTIGAEPLFCASVQDDSSAPICVVCTAVLVLTIPRDGDFTEREVSRLILCLEPDHHIASSLSTPLTLKFFLALERYLLRGADLVVCKVGRWLGVCDSDVTRRIPACKTE